MDTDFKFKWFQNFEILIDKKKKKKKKYNKFIYNIDLWTLVVSTSWNIYIYIYIYKTKQIQFDLNTKHTTSITKPREKKNQLSQNYKQRFKTH